MSDTPKKLTPKQEQFCQEYLIDLNATQAAIRAGYSEKTAQEIGSENLSKPIIQNRISELQLSLQTKTGITQARVLEEFAKIAFFDIRKIYGDDGQLLPISEIDDQSAAAICGVESYEEKAQAGEEEFVTGVVRKVKITDKIKALENLGKHLGIYGKDNSQQNKIVIKEVGYGDEV